MRETVMRKKLRCKQAVISYIINCERTGISCNGESVYSFLTGYEPKLALGTAFDIVSELREEMIL